MTTSKEISVDKRIKKEFSRLKRIFKNIEKDKYDTCIKLIENAAFMTVQMEDMRMRINVEGVTIKYQNGENQFGYKKSPDVETYNSFVKQYTSIIKQLCDLFPRSIEINDDELYSGIKKPE